MWVKKQDTENLVKPKCVGRRAGSPRVKDKMSKWGWPLNTCREHHRVSLYSGNRFTVTLPPGQPLTQEVRRLSCLMWNSNQY